jgi:hypothetical protein
VGTWTDATVYYCDHFQLGKNIVDSTKTEVAKAIEAAQQQFSCSEIEGQLAFINANYSSLTEGIKCLAGERNNAIIFPRSAEKKIVSDLEEVSGTLIKWCQQLKVF